MKDTLVSIIIDNYNYGRFLREAIDSALGQTYGNKEVIVVDDGSTDDSRDIISGYGDRVIPIFKENGGQASTFNAGFAASQGEIICFLDSDDVWLPSKVENVVAAAIQNPKAALIYHRYKRLYGKDERGKALPEKLYRGTIKDRIACSGGWWHCPPTSALSFRREHLAKVMDVPERLYRLAADAYLGSLVPFLGEVYGLKECLSLYRIHGLNYGYQHNMAMRNREDGAVSTSIKNYENCAMGLNQGLMRLGIDRKVDVRDIWGYQRLKWELGEGPDIISLSLAALTFRGEAGLLARLKNIARLWVAFLGIKDQVSKWRVRH